MPKKKKNDRRFFTSKLDLVQVIFVLVSIVAAFVSVRSCQLTYSERIDFVLLDEYPDYVHPLSLRISRHDQPAVTKIAVWRQMRIANNSSKPVSVDSIFFREDDVTSHEAILPFFKKLEYKPYAVLYDEPIQLPIYLEPGETVAFYAILPVSVPEKLDSALYDVLRSEVPSKDSLVWAPLVLDGVFFDLIYQDVDGSYVDELKRKIGARIDQLGYNQIEVTRDLFFIQGGEYTFLDEHNHPVDGMSFEVGGRLFSRVFHHMGGIDNTQVIPPLAFRLYDIFMQTNNGKQYHLSVDSDDLLFGKYVKEVEEALKKNQDSK